MDFQPFAGVLLIPAGQRCASILVQPIDNAIQNSDKALVIELDPTSDYSVAAIRGLVVIRERTTLESAPFYGSNDRPFVYIDTLDPMSAELASGSSTGAWLVCRGPTWDSEHPNYVNPAQVDVSLSYTQTGTANGDYDPLPSTVTLPAGAAAVSIKLRPTCDNVVEEGGESVTVSINSSAQYWSSNSASQEVYISDSGPTFEDTAPIASDDEFEASWNSRPELLNRLELPGVFDNDSDPDYDPIYVAQVTAPAHAAEFHWDEAGEFEYVPQQGFLGDETFEYTISDGPEMSTAAVTIHVVNHPPLSAADSYQLLPSEDS